MTLSRKAELKRFGEHEWVESKRYANTQRCTKCEWVFNGPIELAPLDGCVQLKRSPIKKKPKKNRDPEVYGKYHQWVGTLECILDWTGDCLDPVKGHHIQTVATGGKDSGNEVPLCVRHHAMVHAKGAKTFEKRWAVNLNDIAKAIQRRYITANVQRLP